jgi:hypothetical protein
VNIDDNTKLAILGGVTEIYVNDWDHADSEIGVFICGQHDPIDEELNLSFVDFGVGIPYRVRNHLESKSMRDLEAIEWAMTPGNSTRNSSVPEGNGLDILNSFITEHNGSLEIVSDRGFIVYSGGRATLSGSFRQPFGGTIVSISLKCSNRQYHKHNKIIESSEPLF